MVRVLCVIALWVCLLTLATAPAAANPCTGNPSQTFSQSFPSSETAVTRWEGTVCSVGVHGLVLGITRFRTSPDASYVRLLHDARVSEIYVYYHDGLDFFDVRHFSSGLMTLTSADCPPSRGTLIIGNRACREVRDRGLAYKTDVASRRGEELVIWGVNKSANYKYIIEWRLRDDGVITGRVGATGENLASHHDVPHVHLVTWRLDVDLAGAGRDTVREVTHVESPSTGTGHDTVRVLTVEGGRAWSPAGFRYWRVNDATLRNGQGALTGLRLVPTRTGTARHVQAYAMSDVWVTRGGPGKAVELAADELPDYAGDADSVTDTDVVLWYSTPIHHVPRDEDDVGATQAMFVEFSLVPENLFDASPLP
jgi:primary-amine oxidase